MHASRARYVGPTLIEEREGKKQDRTPTRGSHENTIGSGHLSKEIGPISGQG